MSESDVTNCRNMAVAVYHIVIADDRPRWDSNLSP